MVNESPPPRLLPPGEVAKHVGVTVRTLALWRSRGEGPPWVREGRKHARYPLDGVRAWLEQNAGKRGDT